MHFNKQQSAVCKRDEAPFFKRVKLAFSIPGGSGFTAVACPELY